MQKVITPTTVDESLESLKDNCLTAEKRVAAMKLLIAEEDRFSHDLEQLELAFNRTGRGQAQLRQIRRIRDRFAPNSEARRQAERLLATTEATQELLKTSFEKLRLRYLGSSLIAPPRVQPPRP